MVFVVFYAPDWSSPSVDFVRSGCGLKGHTRTRERIVCVCEETAFTHNFVLFEKRKQTKKQRTLLMFSISLTKRCRVREVFLRGDFLVRSGTTQSGRTQWRVGRVWNVLPSDFFLLFLTTGSGWPYLTSNPSPTLRRTVFSENWWVSLGPGSFVFLPSSSPVPKKQTRIR